ncbi:glycosyltransferase [Aristophania vespae]|uniref:Glycosyltransferase n=1 Tax=Aristophania vespae TaxID=2697033 RepID=A0A6P1NEZ7_9PROT|nr:glycosyltransferase family 1 protein [Aristophania vespae]QHI95140.1 glycosyltransferase [Aristophania vespae]UMM64355.1 hypothetical protein DM15PD_13690 [Aristophania vespae]
MLSSEAVFFILDISRLISRAGQTVPTGIDRVELAYAEYLLAHEAPQARFVALSLTGQISALPSEMVRAFIESLCKGWNLGERDAVQHSKKISQQLKRYLLLGREPAYMAGRKRIMLLISHHHLMRQKTIARSLKRFKALFVPMVHDLIPLQYPEYARPREPARHAARMKTVAELSHGVITPTMAVANDLKPLFEEKKRSKTPIWPIPHGVHTQVLHHLEEILPNHKTDKPFFVCLGTIEPRKNHLLLLHLWRQMVEKRGKDNVPSLVLIGKRGWENENIIDLLERSPALKDVVEETNSLSDDDVAALLKGSCGLLFPSFSEGYGLPLAEAMALGVPAICADIAVLREVGGEMPVYLDPLDGPAWQNAIDDFTRFGPLYQAQKERLKGWKPFPWPQSVEQALNQCRALAVSHQLEA